MSFEGFGHRPDNPDMAIENFHTRTFFRTFFGGAAAGVVLSSGCTGANKGVPSATPPIFSGREMQRLLIQHGLSTGIQPDGSKIHSIKIVATGPFLDISLQERALRDQGKEVIRLKMPSEGFILVVIEREVALVVPVHNRYLNHLIYPGDPEFRNHPEMVEVWRQMSNRQHRLLEPEAKKQLMAREGSFLDTDNNNVITRYHQRYYLGIQRGDKKAEKLVRFKVPKHDTKFPWIRRRVDNSAALMESAKTALLAANKELVAMGVIMDAGDDVVSIPITSCFRSDSKQLYEYRKRMQPGSKSKAGRPGYSCHTIGQAIDIHPGLPPAVFLTIRRVLIKHGWLDCEKNDPTHFSFLPDYSARHKHYSVENEKIYRREHGLLAN